MKDAAWKRDPVSRKRFHLFTDGSDAAPSQCRKCGMKRKEAERLNMFICERYGT